MPSSAELGQVTGGPAEWLEPAVVPASEGSTHRSNRQPLSDEWLACFGLPYAETAPQKRLDTCSHPEEHRRSEMAIFNGLAGFDGCRHLLALSRPANR